MFALVFILLHEYITAIMRFGMASLKVQFKTKYSNIQYPILEDADRRVKRPRLYQVNHFIKAETYRQFDFQHFFNLQ